MSHRLRWLATPSRPISTPLRYPTDHSQVSKHDGDPAVSFTVGNTAGHGDERTAQYEGIAEELAGEPLARLQPVYFATWPDALNKVQWPHITWFVDPSTLDPLFRLQHSHDAGVEASDGSQWLTAPRPSSGDSSSPSSSASIASRTRAMVCSGRRCFCSS